MLDNFLFGVASSAYQIEGAWDEDGKAPSIWDEISHGNDKRFRVKNQHTGDIACDHYHQWKQDIGLMKELGVQAYRFSISWSRICTSKDMCTNLKGIKFYQDLSHELKINGIEPFVTLYHWDLPKWLDDIGGWANPKSIDYFRCYAETAMNALGEDVKYWITFNEPAVFVRNFWGHNNLPKAIKNVLLAHGEVVKLYKEYGPKDGKIGISLNLMPINTLAPANQETGAQLELAKSNLDKMHNRIWLDPIFRGQFPENINKLYGFTGKNELKFSKKEAKTASQPMDFLGINYYTIANVVYDPLLPPGFFKGAPDPTAPRDDMNTERHSYGLYQLCSRLKHDYGDIDMYITENGCAYPDTFVHDKRIHDKERIEYIRAHLRYCDKAVKERIKLKGYFYWSLMDNFEWLEGYNKRFGLLYIFYPTQSRVCKDSFHWYKNIIRDKEFRERQLEGIL